MGGGTNEGGELIGSDPDFNWPSAHNNPASAWTNPEYAYDQVDGTYATTSSSLAQDYTDFSHGVPGTDTITGIEVKLEVSGTTAAGTIDVQLSWDGGSTFTTAKSTGTLSDTDAVVTLGGPSDDWGHTPWTPTELNNSNFELRLTGNPSSNNVQVDAIQIKIYHQASGGGGGGGGGAI